MSKWGPLCRRCMCLTSLTHECICNTPAYRINILNRYLFSTGVDEKQKDTRTTGSDIAFGTNGQYQACHGIQKG